MYELIVFDWDGTLMDSEGRIVACMQAAARDLGVGTPSRDETKEVIGLGLQEAVMQLFPQVDATGCEQLVTAYRHHFLGGTIANSELFAGVEPMLQALTGRELFLAVATGKSRRGLEKELDETGLRHHFHATRCADEAFSKPHPQMLQDILNRLGVDASRTLVVGDTEYDMQMAGNAGAAAVGVTYGVHAPQRLMASGALACFDRIEELPAWLAALENKREIVV